jgi:hypothetical protein
VAVGLATLPRPGYLTPTVDPDTQARIVRVTDDAGRALAGLPGTWGADARHVYSRQPAWSSDGALLCVQNRGGEPSLLLLDGHDYRVRRARCEASPLWDDRWHPALAHAHEMINVDRSGRELCWYDMVRCARTRTWRLPFAVAGLGAGEGNPSADGRFVALGDARHMFVVDMDPQPPYAPWPHVRIGPVYAFPPESLSTTAPDDWAIGNLSVSASGRFVDVKFSTGGGVPTDAHRIFEVDPRTLALRPHAMAADAMRCDGYADRPNGWIFPLKHADLALDPFDHDADVLVGGRSCPGSSIGRVVKVRLRDGHVTALTDPTNEAAVSHVSTRNVGRPGWAYVSYFRAPGKRDSDTIVAVKLDGSRTVERWCTTRTAAEGCYRCEAHPCPSPDGRRVVFASNWAADCTACGAKDEIKAYVVESPAAISDPGTAGRK